MDTFNGVKLRYCSFDKGSNCPSDSIRIRSKLDSMPNFSTNNIQISTLLLIKKEAKYIKANQQKEKLPYHQNYGRRKNISNRRQ
ncbi:hypothetical protein C7972_101605 [Arenibacter sp. ARW7G5Y1]|nr:hypothetical protein C7972_101605 [Arenibacter sp. ARW7G5Y1]